MNFEKVSAKKGYELIMEQILTLIQQGQLKPGDKLESVTALASKFGVGRSTIREALSGLKAMGWIHIRHGGGTFVSLELPSSSQDQFSLFTQSNSLKEVLEVRKILETESAALAAKNCSKDQLIKLHHILNQMKIHVDNESISEQADVEFHLEIVRAARNRLLFHLMESLTNHLQETIRDSRRLWLFGESGHASRLLEEHTAIYEAIEAGDAERASSLMRGHLERVETKLLNLKL